MLLIPFDRPIDWRRPPVVTLALLVANLLAYLLFQLDDGRELHGVKSHYYESGLARIELPHYRDYLARQGAGRFLDAYGERVDDPRAPWFARLHGDDAFLQRLHAGAVVTPADPAHERWQRLRAQHAERLEGTTVWGHGLRPAAASAPDLLSHMFLHGGVFHLVGNMVFLVALGLLVEVALGGLVPAGLCLLGGLGAAGLFVSRSAGDSVSCRWWAHRAPSRG
ncbi:MAG: rhomboid family intramembrane serine protease [Halofilum sp. (in: g-proteobacteria)]|nr:rhomboid family intramembrane serine protease [Halofilum sp. (in: g-proteobacteria)]